MVVSSPSLPRRRYAMTSPQYFEGLEGRRLMANLGLSGALTSPLLFVDGAGSVTNVASYDATTGLLEVNALALERHDPTPDDDVIATPIIPAAQVQMRIRVDAAGNLIGGVAGDDLLITQDLDGPGGNPPIVLLSGEVRPGAFAVEASTAAIETIFQPTGGTLASEFVNGLNDIGVALSFGFGTLSFGQSFSGRVSKGYFGAFPAPPGEPKLASLSGFVYADCKDDGIRDPGDAGIAGVLLSIYNSTGALVGTTTTDSAGKYTFTDLPAGTYRVVENAGGVLTNYFDGKETVGTVGGITRGTSPTNDQFTLTLTPGEDGVEYNFAEIEPVSLSGFVWLDLNDDATIDFGEDGIAGVKVTLYQLVGNQWMKIASDLTDASGLYIFEGLRPGTYAVAESQPCGLADGKESLGTAGGTVGNDQFCNIRLGCGVDAQNYNFGERPPAGCVVRGGQTATIGFWNNKNGQALLRSLNGGATSTDLGNWLAGAFPNLYGNSAVNFAGMINDQVARYFQTNLFSVKGQTKVDAQVLAVAFAVYVTNYDLAGLTAWKYGFRISEFGVGASTFNVGTNGAAFGVANYSTVRVLDLLIATDRRSWEGKLYDANHNGTTQSIEQTYRNMANTIFSRINEQGDIG